MPGFTVNSALLEAIRQRGEKQTQFARGIMTADRWVKSFETCAGNDECYRFAANGNVSFQDIIKAASKKLTYSNDDMNVHDSEDVTGIKTITTHRGKEIEVPEKTLMVFRHTLTTPRKDRDGDILRTKGAEVDPKLPLLWQHVHTQPIGKMLVVDQHTTKTLDLYSAIIDINPFAHDAAVMIDAGMGRFSHGFRALEFDYLKDEKGQETGGFDIMRFEIMEESIVSVPSNVDADTHELVLDLVESGKMTSSITKSWAKYIRDHRDIMIAGTDLKSKTDEEENGKSGQTDDNVDSAPTETSDGTAGKTTDVDEGIEETGTKNDEVTEETDTETNATDTDEKTSVDGESDTDEKSDDKVCPKCGSKLDEKGKCTNEKCDESKSTELTVDKAFSFILANATAEKRKQLKSILITMEQVDDQASETEQAKQFGLI